MTKPSDHVAKARAYQEEADLLMEAVDPNNTGPEEMVVNMLSAIESRLGALTEAVLATVPYVILENAGATDR